MSAELEAQRDFLLRSLEDLEAERAAGDVDEHDYVTLKDDYTARAAAVLRALDAGRAAAPAASRRRGRRSLLVVGGVALFAVVAGVLVAQSAGRRDPGDTATGDVRQSITEKLNEAGRLGGESDYEGAIALYDDVLEDDPDSAEALAYKGWMTTLDGDEADGLTQLLDAATAHPEYPDVHAFLAIVFFRTGLVEQASRELDRLDELDPPAFVRELVGQLRARIDETLASTTTTTTTVPVG